MKCPKCSAAASDNSKYCRVCAFDLTEANVSALQAQPSFTELPSQSSHISGVYPVQSETDVNGSPASSTELFTMETPANSPPSKNVKIIGGVVLAVVGVLAVVFAFTSPSSKTESGNLISSSNKNLPANSYRADSSSYTSSAPPTSSKTGRLITDLNVRDAPNKEAFSVGIHFKNARVEVLEETSYELNGAVSTWYKIRVYETGCSVDANLGCGKNSPSDSDEGWVNSKYILLD